MNEISERKNRGQWVQTERAAHEAWALLTRKSALAAQIMHLLVARVGDHNAVVISQGTLANLTGASRRGVQKALKVLTDNRWIELRQIGDRGTINAHVINDRVAWSGKRDGIRYSLFSAIVVLSEDEQPDRDQLGQQEPLRRVPRLLQGEQQLPTGPGLPPPSEPTLPGMEPDLPAAKIGDDGA
ncbi:helix-turn-helix domain-containing protein [Loktanella sp. DJP18]|uniref:helix-turn-helix domain-containing protein n=1 Tax=Loktanella sp. DJP18 TaxID=3409788 RepID=UPI003BB5E60A